MAKKKQGRRLTYFYLNNNLHKTLSVNRGADEVMTWCYPLEKRIAYTYSWVKKHHAPAFTTAEVSKMIGRSVIVLKRAILRGDIERPQFTYGLNEAKKIYKYMWSEQDVLDLHDWLLTVHRGRPRADGGITPAAMPSKRELRSMMRQENVLYVLDSDGEFKPTWKALDFN